MLPDEDKPIIIFKKKFSIINVFKEGWALTLGLKLPVFYLICLVAFLTLINVLLAMISLLPLIFLFSARHSTETIHSGLSVTMSSVLFMILALLIMFIIYFMSWFVTTMLIMLGVRKSIGLKPLINAVYKDCKTTAPQLFGLFLIIFLMTVLAYAFHLIFSKVPEVALYLNIIVWIVIYYIAWSIATFAVPLVVIRHYSPMFAFKTGLRAMNRHWIWVVSIYLIMFILMEISAIPLGIGLFWTLPMYFAISGILFRDVFGLQKKPR